MSSYRLAAPLWDEWNRLENRRLDGWVLSNEEQNKVAEKYNQKIDDPEDWIYYPGIALAAFSKFSLSKLEHILDRLIPSYQTQHKNMSTSMNSMNDEEFDYFLEEKKWISEEQQTVEKHITRFYKQQRGRRQSPSSSRRHSRSPLPKSRSRSRFRSRSWSRGRTSSSSSDEQSRREKQKPSPVRERKEKKNKSRSRSRSRSPETKKKRKETKVDEKEDAGFLKWLKTFETPILNYVKRQFQDRYQMFMHFFVPNRPLPLPVNPLSLEPKTYDLYVSLLKSRLSGKNAKSDPQQYNSNLMLYRFLTRKDKDRLSYQFHPDFPPYLYLQISHATFRQWLTSSSTPEADRQVMKKIEAEQMKRKKMTPDDWYQSWYKIQTRVKKNEKWRNQVQSLLDQRRWIPSHQWIEDDKNALTSATRQGFSFGNRQVWLRPSISKEMFRREMEQYGSQMSNQVRNILIFLHHMRFVETQHLAPFTYFVGITQKQKYILPLLNLDEVKTMLADLKKIQVKPNSKDSERKEKDESHLSKLEPPSSSSSTFVSPYLMTGLQMLEFGPKHNTQQVFQNAEKFLQENL
jgi:uncharacterized protein YlbG (UPF0298 family)